MSEYDRSREFCDRICTHVMSYELGIPSQWDTPIPRIDSNPWKSPEEPRRKDLRLTVINRCIHYYQRISASAEYKIRPEGALAWLPSEPTLLYPPATEEQLYATEKQLGFPLPPFLRMLYGQVANGGFGPGYDGLLGTLGGGNKDGWLLTDVYHHLKGNKPSIDLLSCERHMMHKDGGYYTFLADWEMVVPQGYWLDGLLPIIHDGCALHFYLHIPTGNVLFGGEECNALRLMALSLEHLFERWMRDEIFDYETFYKERSLSFGDHRALNTDSDLLDLFFDQDDLP